MEEFWTLHLMGNTVLVNLLIAVAVMGLIVAWQRLRGSSRKPDRRLDEQGQPRGKRPWVWALGGFFIGGAIFGVVGWFLANVIRIFGEFELSLAILGWVACGGAVLGGAVGALAAPHYRRRWWHQITAVVLIVCGILTAAVGVNRGVGYFVNPGQVLSLLTTTTYPEAPKLDVAGAQDVDVSHGWTSPTPLAPKGRLVQATIPAKVSGFAARPAVIYLPPAALIPNPPKLPLLVAFSGQPGSPSDVFESGHLQQLLDTYQKNHGGISPIVVAPDQLGSPRANPMCMDSNLGKNETYLMSDVMQWIHTNLPVKTDAAHTAFIGFSQGATCVIQLGFAHPELVDTLVPISAQLEPTIGSRSVQVTFDGDEAAFKKNTPLAILDHVGEYQNMRASFYVGSDDAKYTGWAHTLVSAAQKHGIDASLTLSPGTGHNWHTAVFGFKDSFPFLISRLGLPQ